MPAGRPAQNERPLFGERLALARQSAGLTQEDLAKSLNTTQSAITNWERNSVALKPEQVAALAVALNVSADYLLGLDDTLTTSSPQKSKGKK